MKFLREDDSWFNDFEASICNPPCSAGKVIDTCLQTIKDLREDDSWFNDFEASVCNPPSKRKRTMS